MKRVTERETALEREVERLRDLLASDPSTMRRNIESMWANIERMERKNAALRTLLADAMRLLIATQAFYEADTSHLHCRNIRVFLAKLEAQCK